MNSRSIINIEYVVSGVFGLRGTHDGWSAKLARDAEETEKCAGR